jgi:hypothetical protein
MFGGFLIARYGFSMTFMITAFMQLVAWAVLLPLIWLVPRNMPKRTVAVSMVPSFSSHGSIALVFFLPWSMNDK